MAIVFWSMYHRQLSSEDDSSTSDSSASLNLSSHGFGLLAIFVVVGIGMSIAWLELFKWHARTLIWIALLFSPVMMVGLGFIFLGALDQPIVAVIFFIVAALNLLYVFLVRSRIPFSASILTISVQVLQRYPSSNGFALLSAGLQLAWLFVWVIAAAGAHQSLKNQERYDEYGRKVKDEENMIGFVWFLLLISFYWTLQVLKNVIHVTAAGLMGSWYFHSPQVGMPVNPTWSAFKRASWSSFGSICFGSLIIAVVKALRHALRSMTRAQHPVVRCIVLCLVQTIERLVEFFNQFAFTYVAIYGKDYLTSARETMHLLASTGLTAIINDNLVDSVLFFAALVNGVVGAGIGAVLAGSAWNLHLWGLWSFIGFLVALGLSLIIFELIESAVTSFFVSFAIDPAVLQQTKPHVYDALMQSINQHRQVRPTVYAGITNPILLQQQPTVVVVQPQPQQPLPHSQYAPPQPHYQQQPPQVYYQPQQVQPQPAPYQPPSHY